MHDVAGPCASAARSKRCSSRAYAGGGAVDEPARHWCRAPIRACAIARCSARSTSCSTASTARSRSTTTRSRATAPGARRTRAADDDDDASTGALARVADVRGGRERVAEPAVHDGVPRRRRARGRQPHAEQGKWIAAWIADPLDGVHLVLVSGRHAHPRRARQGVQGGRRRGRFHQASRRPACSRTRGAKRGSVEAHARGGARIATHLGDDAGRVPELVELLRATYGDKATLDVDEVEPYLGELGTAGTLRSHERDRPRRARRRARGAAPHADRDQRVATEAAASDAGDGVARVPLPAAAAARRSRDHHQGTGRRGARHEERGRRAVPARGGDAGSDPTDCAKRSVSSRRPSSTCAAQSGLDERTVIDVLVARLAALSRRQRAVRSGAEPSASEPRSPGESGLTSSVGRVRAAHQARGAAGGLVLVDDALGAGLVQPLLRGLDELVGVVGVRPRPPWSRA